MKSFSYRLRSDGYYFFFSFYEDDVSFLM